MGIATVADRDALLTYCEAVVAHRRASATLATTPTLIEGHRGVMVRNPAFALQRDMSTVICRFAHEFGLTPSARSGIRMDGTKSGQEKSADRYLTG
jgi:P27 family predicted phage terminase small subunit